MTILIGQRNYNNEDDDDNDDDNDDDGDDDDDDDDDVDDNGLFVMLCNKMVYLHISRSSCPSRGTKAIRNHR